MAVGLAGDGGGKGRMPLRRRGGRTAQRRRGEGERSLRCRRGVVVVLVGTEIDGGRRGAQGSSTGRE
jgi:hypothetical protein